VNKYESYGKKSVSTFGVNRENNWRCHGSSAYGIKIMFEIKAIKKLGDSISFKKIEKRRSIGVV
jgi:hypothetical protein